MSSGSVPYHLCCKALENLYLEDSYVLNISKNNDSICFDMEFVLTEKHEFYHPAKEGEQFCYKRGKIEFISCTSSSLQLSNRPASTDANNEQDFGNIDSFVKFGDGYFLEGCWGTLDTKCDEIAVKYELDELAS